MKSSNTPVTEFKDIIFKLQFDGLTFSTNSNEIQSFWPLHNYTKEVKISNVIKIKIKDKEFLEKVKQGKYSPKRKDVFEMKLTLEGDEYIVTEVLKYAKSEAMVFETIR